MTSSNPASTISPNNSLPCLHGPLASPACGGGRGFEICRPTGPPRPLSRETGWPTDRPSCPPPTPRDPTRMTRPTDSPAPVPPPSGWVGPPDRPTLPRAVLGRKVNFQLRLARVTSSSILALLDLVSLSIGFSHLIFAVAIFNSLGAPFGRPVPRSRRPLGHPPPRPHTTLPYVPRNSLKGAGSALGVQWVGGFSHGGGRVRRGLEWVCAMLCP